MISAIAFSFRLISFLLYTNYNLSPQQLYNVVRFVMTLDILKNGNNGLICRQFLNTPIIEEHLDRAMMDETNIQIHHNNWCTFFQYFHIIYIYRKLQLKINCIYLTKFSGIMCICISCETKKETEKYNT